MTVKATAQGGRQNAAAAALGLLFVLLTVFSEQARQGIVRGTETVLGVLVPSLFPFMVLSDMAVRAGICERPGRLLHAPARLLGFSGVLAPVVLLSVIGGYPVGARAIAHLCREGRISKAQAQRAALSLVCSGPGFCLSFVGGSLWHSTALGAILYAAQVLSVPLTAIAVRIMLPLPKEQYSEKELSPPPPRGDLLVNATQSAAHAMLHIAAPVLLFASLIGMIGAVVTDSAALAVISGVLDVCSGVKLLSQEMPLWTVAFALGFGGICVHQQIFAFLGDIPVNKGLFFLFRIFQGGVTALLTHFGARLFLGDAQVFSVGTGAAALTGNSLIPGAALPVVALAFLFTLKQTD